MPVERLQRSLARAGFGSRRACEELIAAGRVQINGREATLGDRVDPSSDEVRVDGAKVNVDPELRTFALHKPRDVTTTMRDPHAERDLTHFLPKAVHVFPVGRLDRDTEGLLLLTNDGALAHRLTHPRYAIEKEYLAEVDRPPSNRQLSRLRRGVELDDGVARTSGDFNNDGLPDVALWQEPDFGPHDGPVLLYLGRKDGRQRCRSTEEDSEEIKGDGAQEQRLAPHKVDAREEAFPDGLTADRARPRL